MAKIVKLQWQLQSRAPGYEGCKAQTPLGEFWASNIHGSFKVLRRHVWDNDTQDDILSSHPDWPTAKKAAQKHFDDLVNSLIKQTKLKEA